MPRLARKKSKTGIYHVILRGINRQDFFHNDDDMEKMLVVIKSCAEVSKFKVHAYCLMTNHVHLLVQSTEDPGFETLSQMMKRIGIRYAIYYNSKYNRIGSLFQDRYRSEAVETDRYFLAVLRYIHQNPIKAGLVKNADAYKWSSNNAYITGYPHFVYTTLCSQMLSEQYESYMKMSDTVHCLDVSDTIIPLSDLDLSVIIEDLTTIPAPNISSLERKKRNEILRKIIGINGATIKQISRVTGVSNGILYRVMNI